MIEPPLVYIDANPFIYAIEGDKALAHAMMDLFRLFRQGSCLGVTSELTLAEVLAKARPPARHRTYLGLILWSGVFDLRSVTRDILIDTAKYRRNAVIRHADGRETMPRLPDAIHVVTAIRSRCAMLVSADRRLKVPRGMSLVEANLVGITGLIKELS
jgi:predicted nucleic acid-binding protein